MRPTTGEKAPYFEGKDQDGNLVKLSGFLGKKLVLYFYPNDDTPTCTKEACNLRDHYLLLKEHGYEIIGISANHERSHRKFIKKYRLPFKLIADTDRSIHEKYDTWVEKSMFGRTFMGTARITFLIDESGTIEKIIDNVVSGDHAAQILK